MHPFSDIIGKFCTPTIGGMNVFSTNKSFVINAKTDYLFRMVLLQVSVERYGLISKTFSVMSKNGKTEGTYLLKSDLYLSHGK
jgi:hypothetical protein